MEENGSMEEVVSVREVFFVPLLGRAVGVWRKWDVVVCRREK